MTKKFTVRQREQEGVEMPKEIELKRDRLKIRREVLINYLIMKTEAEDWHAVADVAMDLRELDVEIRVLAE